MIKCTLGFYKASSVQSPGSLLCLMANLNIAWCRILELTSSLRRGLSQALNRKFIHFWSWDRYLLCIWQPRHKFSAGSSDILYYWHKDLKLAKLSCLLLLLCWQGSLEKLYWSTSPSLLHLHLAELLLRNDIASSRHHLVPRSTLGLLFHLRRISIELHHFRRGRKHTIHPWWTHIQTSMFWCRWW